MNPNYGKSNNPQRGSVNNFDFDLGLGSSRSTSLNDKKHNTSSSYSSLSSNQSRPTNLPNRPTWVHQSAPNQANLGGLSGIPTSMVGDISGKSWNSTAPSSGIGIVVKNPNLFGDLVGSALGQGKGSNNSNTPLKSVAPVKSAVQAKNVYSMGKMADLLPKMNSASKSGSGNNWGSSEKFGAFTSSSGGSDNGNNRTNLGGPSMHKYGGGLGSSNKDPFGSLVDFTSKPSGNLNAGRKTSNPIKEDDPFGGFQNASNSNTQTFGSNSFVGSTPVSDFKTDSFEMPTMNHASQNPPPVQASSNVDPLDVLFSTTSSSAEAGIAVAEGVDDWGMESEVTGGNDGGMTTEIEGLPPPPAGVTASSAKNKGMDNYKQGQYADAIKWLSWAVILLAKKGDNEAHMEVLSSRASCYKEVGEYKKAVADCTKVLEHDGKNVNVLVQRALLYESMEKYRLGAEDLRTVLKIDPSNRVARSTVHRLNKMAD